MASAMICEKQQKPADLAPKPLEHSQGDRSPQRRVCRLELTPQTNNEQAFGPVPVQASPHRADPLALDFTPLERQVADGNGLVDLLSTVDLGAHIGVPALNFLHAQLYFIIKGEARKITDNLAPGVAELVADTYARAALRYPGDKTRIEREVGLVLDRSTSFKGDASLRRKIVASIDHEVARGLNRAAPSLLRSLRFDQLVTGLEKVAELISRTPLRAVPLRAVNRVALFLDGADFGLVVNDDDATWVEKSLAGAAGGASFVATTSDHPGWRLLWSLVASAAAIVPVVSRTPNPAEDAKILLEKLAAKQESADVSTLRRDGR